MAGSKALTPSFQTGRKACCAMKSEWKGGRGAESGEGGGGREEGVSEDAARSKQANKRASKQAGGSRRKGRQAGGFGSNHIWKALTQSRQ